MAAPDIFRNCWEGRVDEVRSSIAANAALVSSRDDSHFGGGYRPLHYAAYRGNDELCALLLASGAPLHDTNDDGCTPLLLAAQQGHARTAAILLLRGADPTGVDRAANTILDLAYDRPDIIAMLQSGTPPPEALLPSALSALAILPRCAAPARPAAAPTLAVLSCTADLRTAAGGSVASAPPKTMGGAASGGATVLSFRLPSLQQAAPASGAAAEEQAPAPPAQFSVRLEVRVRAQWRPAVPPAYHPQPPGASAAALPAVALPPSQYEVVLMLMGPQSLGASAGGGEGQQGQSAAAAQASLARPTVLFQGSIRAAPPSADTGLCGEDIPAVTAALQLPLPAGAPGEVPEAASPPPLHAPIASASLRLVARLRCVNALGASPWSAPSQEAVVRVELSPPPQGARSKQQQQRQGQGAQGAEPAGAPSDDADDTVAEGSVDGAPESACAPPVARRAAGEGLPVGPRAATLSTGLPPRPQPPAARAARDPQLETEGAEATVSTAQLRPAQSRGEITASRRSSSGGGVSALPPLPSALRPTPVQVKNAAGSAAAAAPPPARVPPQAALPEARGGGRPASALAAGTAPASAPTKAAAAAEAVQLPLAPSSTATAAARTSTKAAKGGTPDSITSSVQAGRSALPLAEAPPATGPRGASGRGGATGSATPEESRPFLCPHSSACASRGFHTHAGLAAHLKMLHGGKEGPLAGKART